MNVTVDKWVVVLPTGDSPRKARIGAIRSMTEHTMYVSLWDDNLERLARGIAAYSKAFALFESWNLSEAQAFAESIKDSSAESFVRPMDWAVIQHYQHGRLRTVAAHVEEVDREAGTVTVKHLPELPGSLPFLKLHVHKLSDVLVRFPTRDAALSWMMQHTKRLEEAERQLPVAGDWVVLTGTNPNIIILARVQDVGISDSVIYVRIWSALARELASNVRSYSTSKILFKSSSHNEAKAWRRAHSEKVYKDRVAAEHKQEEAITTSTTATTMATPVFKSLDDINHLTVAELRAALAAQGFTMRVELIGN